MDCVVLLFLRVWFHRQQVQGRVALQGNLEPVCLFADNSTITKYTRIMLEAFQPQSYIANLGHGVLPGHNPQNIQNFVTAVHSISEEINQRNQRNKSKQEEEEENFNVNQINEWTND